MWGSNPRTLSIYQTLNLTPKSTVIPRLNSEVQAQKINSEFIFFMYNAQFLKGISTYDSTMFFLIFDTSLPGAMSL